jgi:hypothetical protein
VPGGTTVSGDGKTIEIPRGKNGAAIIGKDGKATAVEPGYTLTIDANGGVTAALNLPFADVTRVDWFYDGAAYVWTRGLMSGVTETIFAPQTTLTRAMLITILARESGVETSGGEEWYSKAIEWGISNGITDGTNPDGAITREQFAAMLWRYAGEPDAYVGGGVPDAPQISGYTDAPQISGYTDAPQISGVPDAPQISVYTDAPQISDWARDAMAWAVSRGLITGRTATTLVPQGTATRAEAATILKRYLENMG